MIKSKENIDEIFRQALDKIILSKGWGAKRRMALQIGVAPSFITDILKGRKYGSEQTRRTIAESLGYSYEEFLDLGRGKRKKREQGQERILLESPEKYQYQRRGKDPLVAQALKEVEEVLLYGGEDGNALLQNIKTFHKLIFRNKDARQRRKLGRPIPLRTGEGP